MAKDGFVSSGLTFEVVSARTIYNPTKFVEYTIKIRKSGSQTDDNPSVIERRYTEFLELYTKLREEFPDIVSSCAFPKKALLGNFSPEVITSRRVAFESLLLVISNHEKIKESPTVVEFLNEKEHKQVLELLQDENFEVAIGLLEKSFRLLNKLLTDRHPTVLRTLCLLVACCDASGNFRTRHYVQTAVTRYESVSDTDSLRYYVPLLQLAVKTLQDCKVLQERLSCMKRRGVKVDGCPSLLAAVMADLKPTPTLSTPIKGL